MGPKFEDDCLGLCHAKISLIAQSVPELLYCENGHIKNDDNDRLNYSLKWNVSQYIKEKKLLEGNENDHDNNDYDLILPYIERPNARVKVERKTQNNYKNCFKIERPR